MILQQMGIELFFFKLLLKKKCNCAYRILLLAQSLHLVISQQDFIAWIAELSFSILPILSPAIYTSFLSSL
jgi:hypothetical protein